MKNILKWSMMVLSAMALMVSCNTNGNEDKGLPKTLTLTADKLTIVADGVDEATFTVKYGNDTEGYADVTSQATITDRLTGVDLSGNKFSSTNSGAYRFSASYDGKTSDIIDIAVEKVIPPGQVGIKSSRNVVMPDGIDYAVLTVFFGADDVTADATIKNKATGAVLEKTSGEFRVTLSDIKPVEYVAEYDNKTSESITISATPFYKRLNILEFTGNWCKPCYQMFKVLKAGMETRPNRVEYLAIHIDDGSGADPMQVADGVQLAISFNVKYFPTCMFDLDHTQTAGISISVMNSQVDKVVERGAQTGIKATSKVTGREVSVDVDVMPSVAGDYYLTVFYMEDRIPGTQNGYEGSDTYYHDSVLRKMVTETFRGVYFEEMAVGEAETRNFKYTLEEGHEATNGRWYIFTTRNHNNKQISDNIITCPADGSVDYEYEEVK